MERVNMEGSPQLIVSRLRQTGQDSETSQQAEPSTADQRMFRFWQRMAEIYGHRWVSSFGETPSPMWCSALNRVSDDQVRRGIANCVTQRIEWPPTLTEFIGICVTVPGLPSADEAADDAIAIARKWKRPDQCIHPIVWHCLDQIGGFGGIAEDVLRKRFLSNFDRAKSDLAEGKPLSAIPQPLPAPKDAQPDYTSEQALASKAAAIAKIKAMFNGG